MTDILATITEFFSFIGNIIKEFFGFFTGLIPSNKPEEDATEAE